MIADSLMLLLNIARSDENELRSATKLDFRNAGASGSNSSQYVAMLRSLQEAIACNITQRDVPCYCQVGCNGWSSASLSL
jgi:hypothetical protein